MADGGTSAPHHYGRGGGTCEGIQDTLLRIGRRRLKAELQTGSRSTSVVGSGVGCGAPTSGLGLVEPKLLRTSERSVRSMVAAPSKLPEVQATLVEPKLLRMVERSVRSTVPSMLASPRSSGPMRMEPESAGCPPKVVKGTGRAPLSKTARLVLGASWVLRMPVVWDFP